LRTHGGSGCAYARKALMAGQRVTKDKASASRTVAQFEARIGYFYLTRMGRVCKLLRIEPPNKDRTDSLLGFGYVDEAWRVLRLGPSVDGFDMHERVASRLLTRIVKT
jgi:hypothetical protein